MNAASIARRLTAVRARVRALRLGDRGAVTILFALCGGMMIATLCLALDTIDDGMTLSRMQSALDVATLTAGAETGRFATITGSNLAQWQADARAYYNANMPSGYANVSMPDKNFTATVTSDSSGARTLALSATGTLSLIAPFTLGQSGLTVSTTTGTGTTSGSTTDSSLDATTATVSVSNAAIVQPKSTLELVMVLDNTGSMADAINGVTKMQGLQSAASALVSNLLSSTTADSHIGLVPFTTTVNVKGALPANGSWLSRKFAYNSTNVQMAADSTHDGWGGCAVEPRDASGNLAASAYSPITSPKFTPYYYNVPPAGLTVRTYKNNQLCGTVDTSTRYLGVPLTLGSGYPNYCGFSGNGVGNGITTYFDQSGTVSSTSAPTQTQNSGCIARPVTFLTNDASTLNTAISGMTPKGDTIIPVGILWGWRMLSSAWSNDNASGNGWISTDTSYPKPETTQNLQRVMIVLTDGENNVGAKYELPNNLYFNGLSGVGTNQIPAPTITRADGTTLANATMDYSETYALPSNGNGYSYDINDFQLGVCNAVKASGITIYAITFGSVSTIAAATMQSCASSGDYYHAPNSATLNTIFQAIAGNLGILRLTQ